MLSCGVVVCGVVVLLCCCVVVLLWCCGVVVLWCCGVVVLWCGDGATLLARRTAKWSAMVLSCRHTETLGDQQQRMMDRIRFGDTVVGAAVRLRARLSLIMCDDTTWLYNAVRRNQRLAEYIHDDGHRSRTR